MSDVLIQFELDEDSKLQASFICHQLGIDVETYLRICIARMIYTNGIPFDMVSDKQSSDGIKGFREIQRISEENGNSDITLDEINEENRLSRVERDTDKKTI